MAQNFRSAFHGFNREDVVRYLEFLNNKHNAQVSQLVSDAEFLRQQLSAQPAQDGGEVEALKARCQELEEQLARANQEKAALELRCQQLQSQPVPQPEALAADRELEAYRRAERTERLARERAGLICRQASGVLAEATAKVDDASERIGGILDNLMAQLEQLRRAVDGSRLTMQDAATTMRQFHLEEK